MSRRPSASDHFWGHGLVIAITAGATVLTGFAWFTQRSVAWYVPFIALLLWKESLTARRRVVNRRDWQSAWNEMEGGAAPQKQRKLSVLRWLLGGVLWLSLVSWLSAHEAESGSDAYKSYALCFSGLSLWALRKPLAWIAKLLLLPFAFLGKPLKRTAEPRESAREFIVAPCLRVRRSRPSLPQILAALPPYVKPLLWRLGAAPPPVRDHHAPA
jgi:hypothetical protein